MLCISIRKDCHWLLRHTLTYMGLLIPSHEQLLYDCWLSVNPLVPANYYYMEIIPCSASPTTHISLQIMLIRNVSCAIWPITICAPYPRHCVICSNWLIIVPYLSSFTSLLIKQIDNLINTWVSFRIHSCRSNLFGYAVRHIRSGTLESVGPNISFYVVIFIEEKKNQKSCTTDFKALLERNSEF